MSCLYSVKGFVACHNNFRQKSATGLLQQLIVSRNGRTIVWIPDRLFRQSPWNDYQLGRSRARNRSVIEGRRSFISSSGLKSTSSAGDSNDAPRGVTDKENCTTEFLSKIEKSLTEDIFPLVQGQESVVMVVGVSGGCDSIGLLHALVQLQMPRDGIELHAIHFDHQQRGAESDSDRAFVTRLCKDLNVPLHTYYWDEDDHYSNKTPTAFSQDIARKWRRSTMYKLLKSLSANDSQRGLLVTAHHKDDSTETLLLKLLRGVHITNLVGMESVVEPGDMPQAIWARPLLSVTKAKIQDFLTEQSLEWREDSSNAQNKYKRNRVRNEVIPLLADIVGGDSLLEKRLDNLSLQSQELRQDLTRRAHDYLQESGSDRLFLLSGQSTVMTLVEKEALHLWSKQRGCTLSYDKLQGVCKQLDEHPDTSQWTLQVGDKWNIIRNGASLDLINDHGQDGDNKDTLEAVAVEWSLVQGIAETNQDGILFVRVSQAPTCGTVAFRRCLSASINQQPFTPFWKNKPIKVKEFLRGQKIPLHLRGQIPSIVSDNGVVIALHIKGEWEVDAAFQPTIGDTDKDHIMLQLKVKC